MPIMRSMQPIFDHQRGVWYDPATGYIYDQNMQLWYDPATGRYLPNASDVVELVPVQNYAPPAPAPAPKKKKRKPAPAPAPAITTPQNADSLPMLFLM